MEQIKIAATITQGNNGLFCLTLYHTKEEHEINESSNIAKYPSKNDSSVSKRKELSRYTGVKKQDSTPFEHSRKGSIVKDKTRKGLQTV